MFNKNAPETASLLISEPFMLDPNFQRAVVLLCEHDGEEGTVGYVLNQPATIQLRDVVDSLPDADFPLFFGGPVAQESIHFIHKCYDRLNSGIGLGNGIFWGGNFESLKVLIQRGEIKEEEIKFFIGYSGWSPGQLDRELQENAWVVSNQYNPDIAFVNDGENLWKEAVVSLGPKYAHVANFPQNPMWN
ncbi:YqgE/AlgH family protein [Parapedobacter lycopersici]|uniref:YqgE/AlgH family protein n=1 Tax=Parapedobacter lycopersici TaxID=1864939 RepID=UPI00214DC781|nr:YqgE/AlgH family protein [Parapedobacter lycopersici]